MVVRKRFPILCNTRRSEKLNPVNFPLILHFLEIGAGDSDQCQRLDRQLIQLQLKIQVGALVSWLHIPSRVGLRGVWLFTGR